MTRKSPVRHKVRSHKREGKPVRSFERGKGTRPRLRKIVGEMRIARSRITEPKKEFKKFHINFREWDASRKSEHPMKTPLDFNFFPKELEGFLLDKIVYSMPYEEEHRERIVTDTRGEKVTIKVPTGRKLTGREEKIFGEVFDILKDESNWKTKTHYAIVKNRTEADLIARGTKYYTGGAEIYALSDGAFMVGSKGYYHYTGA